MHRIKRVLIVIVSMLVLIIQAQSVAIASEHRPQSPRITIITSLYKSDEFIEGFLEDIVKQTIFNECELLLINANSPGNEELVIKKYLCRYPNITYIKLLRDPGIYGVWNLGVQLANSEYITNANADDRLAFECYEIHAHALDNFPEVDLIYSDFLSTQRPNETMMQNSAQFRSNFPEFEPSRMANCLPNNHPMWRKSLHDKYGYFDETYISAGDWEMWCRAVAKGAQFKKVSGLLSLLYNNPVGLSTDSARKHMIEAERKRVKSLYGYYFGSRLPMLVPLK